MNFEIKINLENDEFNLGKYDINDLYDKIVLTIETNINETYLDATNDIKALREYLNETIQVLSEFDANKENIVVYNTLNKFTDKELKNIINSIATINISGDYKQIKEYIDKNNLTNKKIVIDKVIPIDITELNKLLKYFDVKDNIYVMTEGNVENISLEDYKDTIYKIYDYVKEIKSLNLSPLEEIMYAYDIVKNRIYIQEGKNENSNISRDLSKALLGDKIVCVGYSNIFECILTALGYNSMRYTLMNRKEKVGHAINLAYVKDDKYKIDGLYYFDPTCDSRKETDNDINYLYRYNTFLNTRNEYFSKINRDFKDDTLDFSTFKSEFIEELKNKPLSDIAFNKFKSINKVSELVGDKKVFNMDKRVLAMSCMTDVNEFYNIKEVEKIIQKYNKLFNIPISSKTKLRALYNLRKQQFYNDKTKELNKSMLVNTFCTSNWETAEIKILCKILGIDYKNSGKDECLKFIKDEQIELDMRRVRLTKTLKNISKNKI